MFGQQLCVLCSCAVEGGREYDTASPLTSWHFQFISQAAHSQPSSLFSSPRLGLSYFHYTVILGAPLQRHVFLLSSVVVCLFVFLVVAVLKRGKTPTNAKLLSFFPQVLKRWEVTPWQCSTCSCKSMHLTHRLICIHCLPPCCLLVYPSRCSPVLANAC